MNIKSVCVSALCFIAVAVLVFSSCRQRERDEDETQGADIALFEREGDDAVSISDQAIDGVLGQYKTRGNCATITNDTMSIPRKLTVNFGAIDCLCKDNKNRRGKIVITYTGKYKDAGTIRTISFDDYYVNDNEIRGIKTVTNNGANGSGNTTWTIEAQDTIILAKKAGIITRLATRTREIIAGETTPVKSDDKYKVTGSGNGIQANGFNWSMIITQPIMVDHSCAYRLTQGEMQYQPQGKALRTLDYGTGACDNDATININNKIYNLKFM
jgi:hypothetical protein